MNLNRKVAEMNYDGLISDIIPPVQEGAGTIKKLDASADYKRGTMLAKDSEGKLVILGTSVAAGEQKFNGDGSITVFSVTAKPTALTSVKIGTTESTDWVYDASTGKITFGTAPASGTDNVIAAYANAQPVPDCVLCDDATIGTTADEVVTAYTAGCFDPNKVHVASGYTITADDKEALRLRDIVFKAASAAN